jgi:hypothetical protein
VCFSAPLVSHGNHGGAVRVVLADSDNDDDAVKLLDSVIFKQEQRPFLNWPQGVNFVPMGEICPIGGMFTPSFTPRGRTLSIVEKNGGANREFHPPGDHFTPKRQN